MQVPQGRLHLRFLTMSGAVCQRCAPDPTGRAADDAGKTYRGDRDRDGEEKYAARAHEGKEDLNTRRRSEGKGTDQAGTTPLPLHERQPEEQSDRERATRRRNLRTGNRREVTCQDTSRPQRTSVYRRSTDTGFMPTLAHTLTSESGTTRHGKGYGVTSRSCHRGAITCQAGRSGDAL